MNNNTLIHALITFIMMCAITCLMSCGSATGGPAALPGVSHNNDNTQPYGFSCSVYNMTALLAEFPNPTVPEFDSMLQYQIGDAWFPMVNVNAQSGTFQGLANTNFGVSCEGGLQIDTAGQYIFYLTSDGGSTLWMDGYPIVNNDGDHAVQMLSATVTLSKGQHMMQLKWYTPNPVYTLMLEWQSSGFARQVIPNLSMTPLGSAQL